MSASKQKSILTVTVTALFLVSPIREARAGIESLNVSRMLVEHANSLGEIAGVFQDSRGFIWLGTHTGLVRYDGTQLRRFTHMPGATNSISSNQVLAISESPDGDIWLGTSSGLDRFDRDMETFERFPNLAAPEDKGPLTGISSLVFQNASRLIAGTAEAGLYVFDLVDKRFERFALPTDNPRAESAYRLHLQDEHNLWVGLTGGGLLLCDPNTLKVKAEFHPGVDSSNGLLTDYVTAITGTPDGAIWVGTTEGLSRLDPSSGRFEHFKADRNDRSALQADYVSTLRVDGEGSLWVGTDGGGLSLFEPESKTFRTFKSDRYDQRSLSSNVIRIVYNDHDDNLWIAHYPNGLDLVRRNYSGIRTIRWRPDKADWLSESSVTGFAEDNDGNLWISTDGGGLNHYDRANEKFTAHRHDPADGGSIGADAVLSVTIDSQGNIWAGTWSGGLNRLAPGATSFKRYLPDPDRHDALPRPNVWDVFEDSSGILWVATMGGICRYLPETDAFHVYGRGQNPETTSHHHVWQIYEDRQGRLWIATGFGLNRYERASDTFTSFTLRMTDGSLNANNSFTAILQDSNDEFWVGTYGDGLHRFHPENGSFTPFPPDDSLSEEVISSILEDDRGRIWIGTFNGMIRISTDRKTLERFDADYGLQGTHFNRFAAAWLRSGEFAFGGTEGLSLFDPLSIPEPGEAPKALITGMDVFNRPITPGPESALSVSLSEAKHATLRHDQSVIRFHFGVPDFRHPVQHRVEYMLEGFDDDWQVAGPEKTATYTNLDPGDYRLLARALSGNGMSASEPSSLSVSIVPPYWMTTWFRSVLVLSIAGTLIAAATYITNHRYRERLREAELKRRLSEERERVQEQLQQAQKLDAIGTLAGGIAHDFNNILTGILGYLELLRMSLEDRPDVTDDLNEIQIAANRAKDLVAQILTFSRKDTPSMESVSPGSILTEAIRLMRATLAKTIRIESHIDSHLPRILASPTHLHQIAMNLCTNAVHALPEEKGTITVTANTVEITDPEASGLSGLNPGSHVRLTFADDGVGMDKETADRIFDPFFTTKTRGRGTGLGLSVVVGIVRSLQGAIRVSSQPGKGTTFSLYFPALTTEEPEAPSVTSSLPMGSGESVLIVEDERPLAFALARTLSRLNYKPVVFVSSVKALEGFRCREAYQFDIVISDYAMPEKNGAELLSDLRKLSPEIPIILVSGAVDRIDDEQASKLGATRWLAKPYTTAELAETMAEALGRVTA